MQDVTGDIWQYRFEAVIAITTNGQVSRRGRAVMGRGVAAQAARLLPELPDVLGALISSRGNHCHYLGNSLVSFPVEHSPFEHPDLRLIERSARELAALADQHGWKRVLLPRPGCGGGGLLWRDVRPLLEPHLDQRFLLIAAG